MRVAAVEGRQIHLSHAALSSASIALPLREGAPVRVGDAVTLGLRPEHIEIGQAASIGLSVRAEYVESLGSSSQIHAKTSDGAALTVQVPGRLSAGRGDMLQVSAQPQHAYLFNADGRAL
jgi:ABC-type sugar transport system ATPase subunit